MVDRLATGWGLAGLGPPTEALMRFAEKLTLTPNAIHEDDVALLRAHGFGDDAISSAVQVVSYFNYINRVADGLGIDHESFIDELGRSR
jgi:uncharacterized peroxidase-related enzyme